MFIVYSFCKTISKKLFQRIPVMVTANLKKNPISNLSKTPQHSYDKETLHDYIIQIMQIHVSILSCLVIKHQLYNAHALMSILLF